MSRAVALGWAVALLAVLAVPTAQGRAAQWTLRRLPPTPLEGGGNDVAGLTGISCPTESLCVAVGAFDTVAFSQAPTGGSARWHVAHPAYDEPKQSCLERGESPEFCSAPGGSFDGVSCAGESLCVAVGYEGSVIVSTDPSGGAGAWSVGEFNPPHGGANHLTGVSCPSPSLCVAVSGGSNNANGGKILTSTDPASNTWQAFQLPGSPDLRGVSCGTPSLCVAVAKEGRLFASTDPTGGLPAWREVGKPGGPGDLEGISCISTLLCAAGNMTGNVLTSTSPAGGAGGWGEANVGVTAQVTGVSCPTASRCAAVDNNGDVMTSTDPTGGAAAWHFENLVPFRPHSPEEEPPPPGNAFYGISCPSASLCALVGVDGRIFTAAEPFSTPADPPGSHRSRKAPLRPRTIVVYAEHFWGFGTTRHRRMRVRFHFYSKTKEKGFECKRDGGPYRRCRSPLRYWVTAGRHTLRVRAIGPTGLRGPATIKRFHIDHPPEAIAHTSAATHAGRVPAA